MSGFVVTAAMRLIIHTPLEASTGGGSNRLAHRLKD
jgi:hypothetical protein